MINIAWVSVIAACVFTILIVLLYLKDLRNLFKIIGNVLARRKTVGVNTAPEESSDESNENEDRDADNVLDIDGEVSAECNEERDNEVK